MEQGFSKMSKEVILSNSLLKEQLKWNQFFKKGLTFLNFTTTSLKHFHPPTRNPTDAPKIRLKIQAINLEEKLQRDAQ
jgi:hypothetical protein